MEALNGKPKAGKSAISKEISNKVLALQNRQDNGQENPHKNPIEIKMTFRRWMKQLRKDKMCNNCRRALNAIKAVKKSLDECYADGARQKHADAGGTKTDKHKELLRNDGPHCPRLCQECDPKLQFPLIVLILPPGDVVMGYKVGNEIKVIALIENPLEPTESSDSEGRDSDSSASDSDDDDYD